MIKDRIHEISDRMGFSGLDYLVLGFIILAELGIVVGLLSIIFGG